MYSVICIILCSVHFIYIVYCALYDVVYIVYIVHCVLYAVMYILQCNVYSIVCYVIYSVVHITL